MEEGKEWSADASAALEHGKLQQQYNLLAELGRGLKPATLIYLKKFDIIILEKEKKEAEKGGFAYCAGIASHCQILRLVRRLSKMYHSHILRKSSHRMVKRKDRAPRGRSNFSTVKR